MTLRYSPPLCERKSKQIIWIVQTIWAFFKNASRVLILCFNYRFKEFINIFSISIISLQKSEYELAILLISIPNIDRVESLPVKRDVGTFICLSGKGDPPLLWHGVSTCKHILDVCRRGQLNYSNL